jgi:hypothetical protein
MSSEKTPRSSNDTTQGPSGAASTTTVPAPVAPVPSKRGGLFGRKRVAQPETYAEKIADQSLDVNPEVAGKAATDISPVSFSSLFRSVYYESGV